MPQLYQEVEAAVSQAKSILYIGWQYATDDCYQPIKNLLKNNATVTLIEPSPDHCNKFVIHNKWNYPVEVVCSSPLEFLRKTDKKFDVCLWYDGPQSVPYEEFIEFLKHAFQKINTLIVSTPNGEICQQESNASQSWEIFRSNWLDSTWESLGFKVEKTMAESSLLALRSLTFPEENKVAKLFIYPNYRTHSYDKLNHLWNLAPLCIEGIHKHFKIVTNPDDADLFFMGMISCGTVNDFKPSDFPYLEKYPTKHIFELEGDWASNVAPPWLSQLAKSGNSSKPEHLIGPQMIRPAVSKLLSYLGKENPEYELEFPTEKTWSFRGFPDPFGVRAKVVQLAQQLNLPGEFSLTQQFGASLPLTSDSVTEYYQLLHKHLIGLCPRGAGVDSIRFYELCFFGRVPVAVSDAKWLGEDSYDMSFAFRLSPSLSRDEMAKELIKINNLPYEELIKKGKLARKYFEDVVVPYLKDPTGQFVQFLKQQGRL